MNYLIENLRLLYTTAGWSYDTLALKINEGVPEIQRFSKDQIRSYEKGFSAPKGHFKNVLAKFLGVDVSDIIKRKLTLEEINSKINTVTNDAGEIIIANQYEILAQQRVILSLLASMKKPGKSSISDDVQSTLEKMVEEEKEKVLLGKMRKA